MIMDMKGNVVGDIKKIIDSGVNDAYAGINAVMINTYWKVGCRIVEEEQQGEERAEYGTSLLKAIAAELVPKYGSSYNARNLYNMRLFYQYFRNLEILNARVQNLKWTHIRSLLRVSDENARYWYLNEASKEMWNTRTLERNIGSQYYYRLLQSPRKEEVENEMRQLTSEMQTRPETLIKNPIITEFLQLPSDCNFTETQLETAILNHIRGFIMEMGRGFAFVARQKHIVTDVGDFYIDLVFYNYILKCFFLIDLKTKTITHQDVGQMDMYVRMFDDLNRTEGDNPTVGLLLCSETSRDIAKYSVLNGSKQLFASKYLTCLPTEEELRREIERQKDIFRLQSENNDSI